MYHRQPAIAAVGWTIQIYKPGSVTEVVSEDVKTPPLPTPLGNFLPRMENHPNQSDAVQPLKCMSLCFYLPEGGAALQGAGS